MTIHLLTHKLKLLDQNEEVKKYLIKDITTDEMRLDENDYYFKSSAPPELLNLVYDIIPLLSKNLIRWNGLNNYENIELIREAGFQITPGESDGQGPTSMNIHLRDFKITYV